MANLKLEIDKEYGRIIGQFSIGNIASNLDPRSDGGFHITFPNSKTFFDNQINFTIFYKQTEFLNYDFNNLPADTIVRVTNQWPDGRVRFKFQPGWQLDGFNIDQPEAELVNFILMPANTKGYLFRKDYSKPLKYFEGQFDFIDSNVEQGLQYEYGYCLEDKVNNIAWTSICPDFEDIFLSDKEHTLRIRYNPKISSFKTTLAEQKTDTIGAKYPFFFRNGNLAYNELPISGLISYHMDDLMLFDTSLADEYGVAAVARQRTADSSAFMNRTPADEVYLERKYKRKVMDWLNNGQPKLFRSATEGNFIVRLMNVSLSPNDQLGRRLHTFQATAYEIDDYDEDGLQRLGVLNLVEEAAFYYQYQLANDVTSYGLRNRTPQYVVQSLDNSNGLAIKIKDKKGIISFTLNASSNEKDYNNEILVVDNQVVYASQLKEGYIEYNIEQFKSKDYIIVRTLKYSDSFVYTYTPLLEREVD